LPLIKTRDEIDVFVTDTSSKVLSTTESLTRLESENITATRRNVALAAKMISLADEANTQKKEDIQDPQVREELDELEEELRRSRQRWRIMKETVSGVITGSGIDWARDPKLRDLVLDTTDDEA
jgi:vacuolar-type H+-ATPase subunit I/STV1